MSLASCPLTNAILSRSLQVPTPFTPGFLPRVALSKTQGAFFGEPFWNNTWNGFLACFFYNACFHFRIVRMVVYALPCILLLVAE